MPLVAKGAKTFKVRVRAMDGRTCIVSTGTRKKREADSTERFVRSLRDIGDPEGVRAAIVEKRIGFIAAWNAARDERLGELVAKGRSAGDQREREQATQAAG